VSQIQTSTWSTSAASNNQAPPNGAPEGMAAAGFNDTIREIMAAIKVWYNRISPTAIATGTADALVLTYSPSPGAYTSGMTISFYAGAASNTGPATLNVNGLGTAAITKRDGATALGAADIVAGALYTVTYDGTVWRLHATGV
jgi:hypothetical protein